MNRQTLLIAIVTLLSLRTEHAHSQDNLPPPPASLKPYFSPPKEFANHFGDYKSPLIREDGTKVETQEQWLKRRSEIREHWFSALGPWPAIADKPHYQILAEEKREGIFQKQLRLEIAPGKQTDDAFLLIPPGEGPFPAVVVVYYDAATSIGKGKGPYRDFAWQLAKRGYVTLALGSAPETYYPDKASCQLQPLSFHAYEAVTCHQVLSQLSIVDSKKIGIVGHSYGAKWAMFAAALYDNFACAAWSDGGIVFDETRGNVNYWERWYLGYEPGKPDRQPGIPSTSNPRTGPYKLLFESGHDLHELHALMAPRPFLVSGGSEDPPSRWEALNHAIAVNNLLGVTNRVAMTNRPEHAPDEQSNQQIYEFFDWVLKPKNTER